MEPRAQMHSAEPIILVRGKNKHYVKVDEGFRWWVNQR